MPRPPTIADAERRITRFLTTDMVTAFRAVEHETPPLSAEASERTVAELARARVAFSHVRGTADCLYRITAFGDALLMSLQLNVRRFVAVYRVPVGDPIDSNAMAPRFERWGLGAGHAGWTIGWRDGTDPWDHEARVVETYCYAMLPGDFLDDPLEQLYWRTDLVQMTRAFMLESRRMGIALSGGHKPR